jgi:hypothetical protein
MRIPKVVPKVTVGSMTYTVIEDHEYLDSNK